MKNKPKIFKIKMIMPFWMRWMRRFIKRTGGRKWI